MHNLRTKLWLWVIRTILREFECSDKKNASQIVDGCLAVREGLQDG